VSGGLSLFLSGLAATGPCGGVQLEPDLRKVLGAGTRGSGKTSEGRIFGCLFTTYSSGKSKSALRKPNLNILYEIGHRITNPDSQLAAAGRPDN
jgi:hypothetical protein